MKFFGYRFRQRVERRDFVLAFFTPESCNMSKCLQSTAFLWNVVIAARILNFIHICRSPINRCLGFASWNSTDWDTEEWVLAVLLLFERDLGSSECAIDYSVGLILFSAFNDDRCVSNLPEQQFRLGSWERDFLHSLHHRLRNQFRGLWSRRRPMELAVDSFTKSEAICQNKIMQ